MKRVILKWLKINSAGVTLICVGLYEMFSDQLQIKIGGISLVFCGMLLMQKNKITELEERISKLEDKNS